MLPKDHINCIKTWQILTKLLNPAQEVGLLCLDIFYIMKLSSALSCFLLIAPVTSLTDSNEWQENVISDVRIEGIADPEKIARPTIASYPSKPAPTKAPTRGYPTIATNTPTKPRPTLPPTPSPTPTTTCTCSTPKTIPTECEVKLLIEMMNFAVAGDHRLASQWLRLSFHDAGTFDQSVPEGGANGCLMNHPLMRVQDENLHLDLAIETLKTIRDTWESLQSTCIDISSADIIQFSGLFAAVRQEETSPGMTPAKENQLLTFQWGRPDEANCNIDWTLNLPGFALGTSNDIPLRCMMAGKEIKEKMMDKNGFTSEEATALIGAHTIGLTRNVFGDPAPWVTNGADNATPNGPVFDNKYFDFLENTIIEDSIDDFAVNPAPFVIVFPDWFQTPLSNKLNHLDTDIVLAFPTQDANIHPDFHAHTFAFSINNQHFLNTFHSALTKMSKLGVTALLSNPTACTTECGGDNGVVSIDGITSDVLIQLIADMGAAKATAEKLLAETQTAIREEQILQTTPVQKFSLNEEETLAVELDSSSITPTKRK